MPKWRWKVRVKCAVSAKPAACAASVTDRPTVTVCGTPFGVKMFSEGALVVGFSDIVTADGTVNPAKQAGLRLGDRVIRPSLVTVAA